MSNIDRPKDTSSNDIQVYTAVIRMAKNQNRTIDDVLKEMSSEKVKAYHRGRTAYYQRQNLEASKKQTFPKDKPSGRLSPAQSTAKPRVATPAETKSTAPARAKPEITQPSQPAHISSKPSPEITPQFELEYQAAKRLMKGGVDFDDLPSKLKRAVLNYQKIKLGKSRSEAFKKGQVKAADSLIEARVAEEAEYRKLDRKMQGIWVASNIVSMGAAGEFANAREAFEQKRILKGLWCGLSGTLDVAMAATGFRAVPALFKAAGQGLKLAWANRRMIIPAVKGAIQKAPQLLKEAPELISKAKDAITRIRFPKISAEAIINTAKSIPSKIYPYFRSGEKFVDGLAQVGFAKFGLDEAVQAGRNLKEGKIISAAWHSLTAMSSIPAVKWVNSGGRIKAAEGKAQSAIVEETGLDSVERVAAIDRMPSLKPKLKMKPMVEFYGGEDLSGNPVWLGAVKYLDRTERQAYRLYIRDGKFYDASDRLFDTRSASSIMVGGNWTTFRRDLR